ncbi:putative major allergen alt A1 [Cercospora zeina]
MKYLAAAAAASALFTTTTLASPCYRRDDSETFQIKDFSIRKPNGQDISNVSFRILATNGGTLDFECTAYDPSIDGPTANFVPGRPYFCGKDSSLSFSYTPKHDNQQQNELWMWDTITKSQIYIGHVGFDDPICRAGGSSSSDLVCDLPDVVDLFVTLYMST